MPREQRQPSYHYRVDPLQRSPDQTYTHRQTSIWTAEDDETLMAARAQGMNWQPIANVHFPNKSGNACRKRHERLMEKRNTEDWDGIKFEKLAVEYMAVRQQMWNVLAARLGEKWTNIEAKCMEKGIKNISAAYKTAKRKERGMLNSCHDYDPDSGFGGSDTDAEYELDFVPTAATATTVGESSRYMAHLTPPTTASRPPMLVSSTASPSLMASTSPSLMVSTSPSLNTSSGSSTIMASSAPFMQQRQYPVQRYHPVPIQPMPGQGMSMMHGRPILPGPQGKNMSIHAMLSPSPPGDDDEDDEG